MELVKLALPVLFVVFELAVVGFWEVLQQTPLAVTMAKPLVIVPPHVAVVDVMAVTAEVFTTAMVYVEIVTSLPYAVPALLVA